MAEKVEIIIGAKDKFSGAFGKLKASLPSIKTLAVGAGAAVAGLGAGLLAMTKSTANAYDKIQKFSDQLGISTEFLSRMQVAADFSGVKIQTMNKSVQMLTVRLGEAARGIGQGKDAFEDIGIAIRDANGNLKTAEQIMPELAEGFKNMANATEKAEAASKIFGQRGIEMLQMFKDGKEGLAKMTAEAEKFGLVVSAKAGANAAMFNDSLTRLTGSLKGLKNYMAEQLMPTITGLANRMADWVADNRQRIVEYAKSFVSAMAKMVEYGAYAIAGLIDAWRGLQMIYQVLKIAFSSFVGAMVEGLSYLTSKLLAFMEAGNIGGVFDGAIESVQGFLQANKDAVYALEQTGQAAYANLNKIANEGLAVNKVTEFKEAAKELIAELTEAGQAAEPTGIGNFTDANTEKTLSNIKKNKEAVEAAYEALNEMWYEQNTTEEERLNDWYEAQQELFIGHEEALLKLKDVYLIKHEGMVARSLERQNKLLEKQIKDKQKIKKMQAEWEKQQLNEGLEAIKTFGETGMQIYKGFKIAEAVMSTFSGAARALSEYMYPKSLIIAAAVIASGYAQISKIASAHGGLDYVPREQTYLLDKGERVLSPKQNQDLLTKADVGTAGGSVMIENLNFQVLQPLDDIDYEDLTENEIIPALSKLAAFDIRPTGY